MFRGAGAHPTGAVLSAFWRDTELIPPLGSVPAGRHFPPYLFRHYRCGYNDYFLMQN